MKWLNHAQMVTELRKPGGAIFETISSHKLDLWHAVTGVCTEAGELLDAVKKHIIYNKPLDKENIIEELGDLEFYMEQVRQNVDIIRDIVIAYNMKKLDKRYGEGYSDKAAQERIDKT